VLGYLGSDSLAGGSVAIRPDLAQQAVQSEIADKSNMSLLDAAYGVHLIANSNMVRAIRSVSVERGRDPAGSDDEGENDYASGIGALEPIAHHVKGERTIRGLFWSV
jgi:hypothetical protein